MSIQNPVFIPGPTNIPEALRRACDHPTIDHRSPAFAEMLAPARAGVRRVLKSREAEVFLFSGTGTAGWEAALTNTLSPGDTVLAARNGMFSQKWIDMCQRHGLEVIIVETPWGEGLPVARFEEILTKDTAHRIKAVLATHNETATGVVSDVAGVRRALDAAQHPALFFVDGVSSIGSMDFRMDEWGVDIAVTGSQKGFMLPPGLAILGVSTKARAHKGTLPRTYLDFDDLGPAMENGSYPYTPPVGLIHGLSQSCDMLLNEGLDAVFMRHARLALGVRAAAAAWGLKLCAARPALYSNSVTAIRTPAGFDANRIVAHAAHTYGVAFGTGLGTVAGQVFRIGHLGMLTDVMVLSGIATAEMVMADLGLDITLGSGTAAAQDVFRSTTSTALREAA